MEAEKVMGNIGHKIHYDIGAVPTILNAYFNLYVTAMGVYIFILLLMLIIVMF